LSENANISVSFSALRSSFTVDGSSSCSGHLSSKRRKVETSKPNSTLKKYFSVQMADLNSKSPTKEIDQSQESPKIKSFEQFSEISSQDECRPKLKISFFEDFKKSSSENSSKSENEEQSMPKVTIFGLIEKSEIEIDLVKEKTEKEIKIWDEDKGFEKTNRKTRNIEFSFESLRKQTTLNNAETKNTESNFRRFLAKISPTENETAEDELRKEFCRDDFRKMKIFGQVGT